MLFRRSSSAAPRTEHYVHSSRFAPRRIRPPPPRLQRRRARAGTASPTSAELAANLARFFNRLEDHMADDPANLVLADELTAYLRDCKLRAIARAARAADEGGDYTLGDIIRILGITKQSVHELMRKGQALLAAKRARPGVADLRERRRRRLDEAGIGERREAAR